jgi:predicted nucleic acid-binding protein
VTLIDTNVVIDVLMQDPDWYPWSSRSLEAAAAAGPTLVNEVTYAELAHRVANEADLRSALTSLGLSLARASERALFLAGRAYAYRAAGGPGTSLLADFIIGGHAEAAGLPILTRDPRRYRTYFPAVPFHSPTLGRDLTFAISSTTSMVG